MRFATLMAAVLLFAACNKDKEELRHERDIVYTVAEETTTVHLATEAEWQQLLDRFCDYAEGGSSVTFRNANRAATSATKEAITYSTTDREEMKRWMAQMEDAGMTVTVTYDPATGTWNGTAYATAPLPPDPGYDSTATCVVLQFKVDYLTHHLEGYHFDTIRGYRNTADTIPFSMQYREPCDFGWVKLFYGPTGDTLFAGDIIWLGCGVIEHPATYDTGFTVMYNQLPYPGQETFYMVDGPSPYSVSTFATDSLCMLLWEAVSSSSVYQNFTMPDYQWQQPRLGVFFYPPSVGYGNPADWDYILFMERPL